MRSGTTIRDFRGGSQRPLFSAPRDKATQVVFALARACTRLNTLFTRESLTIEATLSGGL